MTGSATPIVSALPGRMRLRHPLLRRPGHNRALADRLAALAGLRVAESSTAAGSLLVLYDPTRVDRAKAEAHAAASAAAVLGTAPAPAPSADPAPAPESPEPVPAPAAPSGGPGGQSFTRRLNRAAKIGMMGSMAATIAALGVGKRVHAGAGAAFVALMLVHMAIQRKRLFQ